jgi:hypothetical protein
MPGQTVTRQPAWTAAQQEEAVRRFQREISVKLSPMSPSMEAIFQGTDFSNKPRQNSRDMVKTPDSGTTGHSGSTLVGVGSVTPWDFSGEKTSIDTSNRSSAMMTSQEEIDAATARATYAKYNLHYPCKYIPWPSILHVFYQAIIYYYLQRINTFTLQDKSPRVSRMLVLQTYLACYYNKTISNAK